MIGGDIEPLASLHRKGIGQRVELAVSESTEREHWVRGAAVTKIDLDCVRLPRLISTDHNEIDAKAADHSLVGKHLTDLGTELDDLDAVTRIGREPAAEEGLSRRTPQHLVVGGEDFHLVERAGAQLHAGTSDIGAFDSLLDDYSVTEDVAAGYLLGRWDSATLRVIGGVRYEHTKNDIRANTVLTVEEGGELPDGTTADDDTIASVTPNRFKRSYGDWLPSLTIRWEPQQNLVLRAAGYKSLVRPKLSKLAPHFTIEQNDDDEREGDFGNPDLKPYRAWNFDAGVEYYLPGNGAQSAGVFYKDIKDFIVDAKYRDPGTWQGIAYDEATIPMNGDSAKVWGLELSYQQQLRFLH